MFESSQNGACLGGKPTVRKQIANYKMSFHIQPFVTIVIIGATTLEQLKINAESVNVNLNNEIIEDINNIQKTYPNPCP